VIVAREGDAARGGDTGRPAPDRAAVRADATYLVVGGTAGLGLETARWLVERGARHLVLMARREPSADARDAIRAMEERGARVLVVQGDVSRADDVRRVRDGIRASMPPLRGIVQSAGVLEDRALLRQDWDSFARVLAPKVDGSWHLHCLTANEDLDFFVLYSSIAALMGPPGQAAHAAANAFLDALPHHRRAAGRPALSIGWGVWTEIGSAAVRGVAEREAGKGVGAISPAEGLRALEAVMCGDAPQVAVMPMDWRRFLADDAPLWLSELRDGGPRTDAVARRGGSGADRKSTRLNSSHVKTSSAVFCLKKKPGANGSAASTISVKARSSPDEASRAIPVIDAQPAAVCSVPSVVASSDVPVGAVSRRVPAACWLWRAWRMWTVSVPRLPPLSAEKPPEARTRRAAFRSIGRLGMLLVFWCTGPPRSLLSFPTRRSSD